MSSEEKLNEYLNLRQAILVGRHDIKTFETIQAVVKKFDGHMYHYYVLDIRHGKIITETFLDTEITDAIKKDVE